jgi:aminopeptidase
MNPIASSSPRLQQVQAHLAAILQHCFQHQDQAALVVFDSACELAQVLTQAYRANLPEARFLDFSATTPEHIQEEFAQMQAGDLVILIQTTNFRLDAFRIRVELFKKQLKVIEHPHLGRMEGAEVDIYLDSLAYDANYYRGVGRALKQKLDNASGARLVSEGACLYYDSSFENAKLNIGDYTDMPNWGGQFPIGEVFTEAKNLEAVHGTVKIAVFGDTQFTVNKPAQPITLIIERGQVVDVRDSTPEFDEVLANIRADEEVVWVRELGLGLNPAYSFERTVKDIGSFERMCGVHMSLGAKHGIYGKPNFKRNDGKYHVDVFAVTDQVFIGDELVYQDGAWQA